MSVFGPDLHRLHVSGGDMASSFLGRSSGLSNACKPLLLSCAVLPVRNYEADVPAPRAHTVHGDRDAVLLNLDRKFFCSLHMQSVLVANCCENLSVICS